MTIQAPTRITIEVHPGEAGPDLVTSTSGHAFGGAAAMLAIAGEPREDQPVPAAYEPAPCTCLDDEECGADHAND